MAKDTYASVRHSLTTEEADLFAAKLTALKDYNLAQAALNDANVKLIKAGFHPDGGSIMSW